MRLNVQENEFKNPRSKVVRIKIYNATEYSREQEQTRRIMLKQHGITAFSQEAGANVAMHGAPGFGIYGVDVFVETDDAEKGSTAA